MDSLIKKLGVPRKLDVKEFDFFSEGVSLSFAGHTRHRTKTGALASTILVGFMVTLFVYFFKKSFDSTSPQLQYNKIVMEEASKLDLEKSDLYFFLLVSNPLAPDPVLNSSSPSPAPARKASYVGKENPRNLQVNAPEPPLPVDPTTDGSGLTDPSTTDPGTTDPGTTDPGTTDDSQGEATEPAAAPVVEDLYLNLTSLNKMFTIYFEYIQSNFTTDADGAFHREARMALQQVIPCSEAAWFRSEAYRKALDHDSFTKSLIQKYGICFAYNGTHSGDRTVLYGDKLSSIRGEIKLNFTECFGAAEVNPECSPERLMQMYASRKPFNIDLGILSAVVDNSDKAEPFKYAISIQDMGRIESAQVSTIRVSLKSNQVLSESGAFLKEVKEETKAAVDSIRKLQKLRANGLTVGLVNADIQFNTKIFSYEMLIRSSRLVEQYQRQYSSIMDFFGDFGGSVEFIAFMLTLCFNWAELALKKRMMASTIKKEIGWKGSGSAASALQKKEEAKMIDFCGQRSLSFEALSLSCLTMKVMGMSTIPLEVITLAPYLMAGEHKLRKKRTLGENKIVLTRQTTKLEVESAEQAIRALEDPSFDDRYPQFVDLKLRMLNTFASVSLPLDKKESLEENRSSDERQNGSQVISPDSKPPVFRQATLMTPTSPFLQKQSLLQRGKTFKKQQMKVAGRL